MRKGELVVGELYAVAVHGTIPADNEDLRCFKLLRMRLEEVTRTRAHVMPPVEDFAVHGVRGKPVTFARVICTWDAYRSECALRERIQLGEEGQREIRALRARARSAGLPLRIIPSFRSQGCNVISASLAARAMLAYLNGIAAGDADGELTDPWLAPEYTGWSFDSNQGIRFDRDELEQLLTAAQTLKERQRASA